MSKYTQILQVVQGDSTPITIRLRPAISIDGWTLEFRAVTSARNPKNVISHLAADLSDEATEVNVDAVQDFPQRGRFKIRVDDELMYVTTGPGFDVNGDTNFQWTVERGIAGTTAATHSIGCKIELFQAPQIYMDNGSTGGVYAQDADTGVINLDFTYGATADRPAGPFPYQWVLRRTNPGYEETLCAGLLYVLPNPLAGTISFDIP